jgi:hypothetical protein
MVFYTACTVIKESAHMERLEKIADGRGIYAENARRIV